ncbi:MAG: SpoIID/LytB domain-containing protein [Acidimicrobiales bacterium]
MSSCGRGRWRSARGRWFAVAGVAASAVLLGTSAIGGSPAALAALRQVAKHPNRKVVASPFPGGNVVIDGHGWGPGIGMGQWGAFGYAAVGHESYSWILSHFYGANTKLTTLRAGSPPETAPSPQISVAITENANAPVTVTSLSPFSFGGITFRAGTAARAVIDPATGLWTLSAAAGCTATASSWKLAASDLTNPVAVPISQQPTAGAADLLTICRADGINETVRGIVEAYDYDNANTGNQPLARTINILPLEEYVTDVVPSESSSGWGEVGGAGPQGEQWGFQELEAQAVAARSYALAYEAAGGWAGYADICDSDYCQNYPGIVNESAVSTAAVTDTAGQYLSLKGAAVATQYSASTGGYTAPSGFPAVVDAGDSVCLQNTGLWTCNEEHTWTVSVPVKTVESTFPSIGTLQAVAATSRNGLGAFKGRVLTIKITGTAGSVTEPGYVFASQFGLDSNWFLITHPKAVSDAVNKAVSSASGGPWKIEMAGKGTGPLPIDGKAALGSA